MRVPFKSGLFLLHSLLGRVVELVFPGTAEALLSPGVSPHTLHSGEKLGRVGLCVLHTTHHVTNQLSIRLDEHMSETTLHRHMYYSGPAAMVLWDLSYHQKSTTKSNVSKNVGFFLSSS